MIGAHERMEALKKMDSDFHYQYGFFFVCFVFFFCNKLAFCRVGRILLNAFHRKGSPDGNTKSIYERLHKQKLLPLTPDQEPLPDTITCMSLITVFASMRDLPALSTVESLLENGKSGIASFCFLVRFFLTLGIPSPRAQF